MSINKKIVTWILSSLVLVSAVSFYLHYKIMIKASTESIESLGRTAVGLLEESLEDSMFMRDLDALQRTLNNLKNIKPINKILLVNNEFMVKAASDREDVGIRLPFSGEAWFKKHEEQPMSSFIHEKKSFRLVSPVKNKPECYKCHNKNTKYNGYIVMYFSIGQIEKEARTHILHESYVFGGAFICLGFLLFVLSKKLISNRLSKVIAGLESFEKGNYSERILVEGDDEITRLEKSLNHMAGAIGDRDKTVKGERDFSRGLIDSLPGIFYLFDKKGRMLQWSKTFEELSGYSAKEIFTLHALDFIVERDREIVARKIEEVFLSGESSVEADFKTKDGGEIPFFFTGVRGESEDGFYLVGVGIDITERKKAEETLMRNYDTQFIIGSLLQLSLEDRPLEEVLNRAIDLIFSIKWISLESRGGIFLIEHDPDKLIMKAQKGLSKYIQEECATVPLGKCLCGKAALNKRIEFASAIDDKHEIIYEGIRPHGHYCVPILYSDKLLGILNIYISEGHKRDAREEDFLMAVANSLAGIMQRKNIENERRKLITELQNTLLKLSHSQKQWQETFDSITDLVSIHDKDFRIVRANKAFEKFFGIPIRDIINRKCHEVFHCADTPVLACPHERALKGLQPSFEEVVEHRLNKTFSVSTFPFHSPDGEIIGTVHIARDVTDEKEKEMRLIMNERLAALGQMASGIAHELNNPLSSVAACSERLLKKVKSESYEPELFEKYLNIVREEVMRCKNITTNMLSFVRKTTEKKAVDINQILEKTLEIIGFQGRLEGINLIRNYADGLFPVKCDEGTLRQAMLAIITNALDAMHDNGTLTIETGIEQKDKVYIKIGDTGPGIPSEIIGNIFDPFFTTRSDSGGTGLGLSIAKRIILDLQGDINVASEENKGVTFKIILPQ